MINIDFDQIGNWIDVQNYVSLKAGEKLIFSINGISANIKDAIASKNFSMLFFLASFFFSKLLANRRDKSQHSRGRLQIPSSRRSHTWSQRSPGFSFLIEAENVFLDPYRAGANVISVVHVYTNLVEATNDVKKWRANNVQLWTQTWQQMMFKYCVRTHKPSM